MIQTKLIQTFYKDSNRVCKLLLSKEQSVRREREGVEKMAAV